MSKPTKEVKSLKDLIADYANAMCKSTAPGQAKCGCIERNVYGTIAFLQDPGVRDTLELKDIPSANDVLKQVGCMA